MREALQAAALRLAEERGVRALTPEAVCAAAGAAAAAFHASFTHVEEALLPDVPLAARRLRDALIVRPPHESPLNALHGALAHALPADGLPCAEDRARARLVWTHPELMARMLARLAPVEGAIARALREWMVAADDDPRCAVLAATAAATLRVAMGRWACADDDRSLRQRVDEAFAGLWALFGQRR